MRLLYFAGPAMALASIASAQPAPKLCAEPSGQPLQVVAVRHIETGAPLAAWSAAGRSGGTVTVPDGRRITFLVTPAGDDYYRKRRDRLPLPEMVRIRVLDAGKSMEKPIHAGIAGATTVERYPDLGVTLVLARPRCIHEAPTPEG